VKGVAERGGPGEDLACRHLEQQGLKVLERNYLCRLGEIDVIARDRDTVVFIEVKERGDTTRGAAVEAVNGPKRRRVIRAARLWAAAHGQSESFVRFDVVAIDWQDGEPVIRHDKGAFDADGR
jgi:putative endonuclease